MVKHLKKKIMMLLCTGLWLFILCILILSITTHRLDLNAGATKELKMYEALSRYAYYEAMGAANAMQEHGEDTGTYPITSVFLNQNGVVIFYYDSTSQTQDEIEVTARRILSERGDRGLSEQWRYRIREHERYVQITYMDNRLVEQQLGTYRLASGSISLAAMLLVWLIVRQIACWLIKPIEENLLRQKQFVSDASHELKTPLAIIGVNMDMLHTQEKDAKYVGYIRTEIRKMHTLVNEMLMLAEAEAVADMQDETTICLDKLVEGAVLPFEAVSFEQGVTLSVELAPVQICGNLLELERVVGILVDNAIRHAGTDGTVQVCLTAEKSQAILKVINTGDTIPKEALPYIFDRFYRVAPEHDRSENRFGLGLAIAKAIVLRHHGQINVTSDDARTTVFIILPLSR